VLVAHRSRWVSIGPGSSFGNSIRVATRTIPGRSQIEFPAIFPTMFPITFPMPALWPNLADTSCGSAVSRATACNDRHAWFRVPYGVLAVARAALAGLVVRPSKPAGLQADLLERSCRILDDACALRLGYPLINIMET
jgi:hypothetical protein